MKAPKRVPKSERPIASAISRVNIVPEAPTNVPATINKVDCNTYPLAATVKPVNAFNNEITIGTSAPPTGSTKSTPKRSERPAITKSGVLPPELIVQPAVPSTPARVAAIRNLPPGNTTGRVVINSCNFKKVITEPENEVQPTTTVNTVATTSATLASLPRFKYSTIATSAAAPPPTPLKSATNCGIEVILMRRAAGTPAKTPTAIARRINGRL